ncbi:MAG: winged helix-turn-helix domain-containing protein [Acidobacteriota bacterium]|nr:winged helix-turn-helix domain-containing protein [Acidobacteriota bacterium]
MKTENQKTFEFADFRIETGERQLRRGGQTIHLPPKALELLLVLLENHGRVVSKEEIIRRVWAGSIVEEGNLSHNIFQLRKTLGTENKFIETVPKRGYRFVADVKETPEDLDFFAGEETITRITFEEEIETSDAPENFLEKTKYPALIGLKRQQTVFKYAGAAFLSIFGLVLLVFASTFWMNKPIAEGKSTPKTAEMTLITNSGKAAGSIISPDGKFISYSHNAFEGKASLFLRQTDTNNEIKLFESDEIIFGSKQFSPDAKYIYFIAFDKQTPQGGLYRIPTFGGERTKLIENVGQMFSLSPDGTQVAFLRQNGEQKQRSLIIASIEDGIENVVLTKKYNELLFSGCPAWSPDGKTIAFGAKEKTAESDYLTPTVKVFRFEIQTGKLEPWSEENWIEIGMMAWTPDARGVVFVGNRPRFGNQIFYLPVNSKEFRQITKELQTFSNYGISISADGEQMTADLWESSSQIWSVPANGDLKRALQITNGKDDGSRGITELEEDKLIYTARAGPDFDLWTKNSDDSEPEALTSDRELQSEITATPNGKFLFFVSDRAGSRHIFRINADGTNLRQLTFGNSFDSAPAVSSDGAWLVYASYANGQTNIYKISTEGSEPIRLTDYQSVAPAFSPDGKLVSCILPTGSRVGTGKLALISSEGGEPLKTFEIVPFAYSYPTPRWTPDGASIIFHRNEKMIGNLWKQNVKGGEPTKITDFKSELIFNYAISNDGNTFYLSRGKRIVNTVLFKNFKTLLEN